MHAELAEALDAAPDAAGVSRAIGYRGPIPVEQQSFEATSKGSLVSR
jgi:hypothetical protein